MTVSATAHEHPLEPLRADEIAEAARILRKSGGLSARARFCATTLREPDKRALEAGGAVEREALVLIYDPDDADAPRGRNAVVSLTHGVVRAFEPLREGQVMLSFLDMMRAVQLVRADPAWQAALRRRGIDDLAGVQVDPWVTAGFEPEAPPATRMLRAVAYRRDFRADNGYAHPIENLIAFVDLTRDAVLRVEDGEVVPVPEEPGNYDTESAAPLRSDLRPLEITQPEGASFEVEGHAVRWQNWRFRVSLHPTHGLVLHDVGWCEGGRVRKILHRAALSEMVVPYGDPGAMHCWKSVFDAGEMGLGHLVNSLRLGCDCLGLIRYFDASFCRPDGEPWTVERAICLHEEDYGILWKHTDLWTGNVEVRRSRRLVVSSIHTVGSYDYGFYYYLYLDGTLQVEVKLTGVVQTSALRPGERRDCAPRVAPQLAAPNHQHLFCFRLDFDLDGRNNSVYEVDVERLPAERNPHGNAFAARETLLARESQAQRDTDPSRHRFWKVVNPEVRNALGEPVGFRILPGGAPRLLAHPDARIARRAAFATHNLWVTAFAPDQLSAAGDAVNQHPGGGGLPAWQAADRPLDNTDVVVWYSFGVTHLPRPEDWPVMPVEYAGFALQPYGFFDRNPALDVPPARSRLCAEA